MNFLPTQWNTQALVIIGYMVVIAIFNGFRRSWLTAGQCIELIAYGLGAYNALRLLIDISRNPKATSDQVSTSIMAGFALLVVSLQGIVRHANSQSRLAIPTRISRAPTDCSSASVTNTTSTNQSDSTPQSDLPPDRYHRKDVI